MRRWPVAPSLYHDLDDGAMHIEEEEMKHKPERTPTLARCQDCGEQFERRMLIAGLCGDCRRKRIVADLMAGQEILP